MPHIYHIPTWWPTHQNPHKGIFISELIKSIAELSPQYHHTIGVHESSLKWISPRHLARDLRQLFFTSYAIPIAGVPNVITKTTARVIGMNPHIGINYISALIRKHELLIASLPHRPDLIHVHVSYPSLAIGYTLAEKYKIPFLLSEHSSQFPDARFDQFGYDSDNVTMMLKAAKSIVSVSSFLTSRFQSYGFLSSHIIPNAVHWTKPPLKVRAPFKYFNFVLIAVMNDPKKKVDLLLKAIHHLSRTFTEFKVHIAGDGALLPSYRLLADQLSINTYIQWHGSVNATQKMNLLSTAQCLVISSDYETFGITAIEAHSFGLPVLATRCGGPEEIVSAQNGLLVQKNDVEALAQGMLYFIQNIAQYDPSTIQTLCYNRYDRLNVAQQYSDLYRDILRDATPSPSS